MIELPHSIVVDARFGKSDESKLHNNEMKNYTYSNGEYMVTYIEYTRWSEFSCVPTRLTSLNHGFLTIKNYEFD